MEPATTTTTSNANRKDLVEDVAFSPDVVLKARALPYATFRARVDRISTRAAKAAKTEVQATRTVFCRIDRRPTTLCPGMTGYARIISGWKPIGEIVAGSLLRIVRTEFWW